MTLDEQLRAALPSLGLPDERCGPNRGSQLHVADRELYRWILRSFAAGHVPSIGDVALAAREGGVDDVEHALGAMVEHDLIQRTDSGEIGCAYPFSTNPTNHVVTLDNGLRLYAMCAVDALGIPSMLRTSALITTTDPITGARIAITVDSDGAARSAPTAAVVLCAVAAGPGPLSAICCPLVNTYESEVTASAFLAAHAELQGPILTIPDAVACGDMVFGGVLG